MNSGAPSRSPEIDRLHAPIAELEAEVNRLRPEAAEHARAEALSRTGEANVAEVFEQAPAFIAVLRGARHVFERVNAAYYGVVGRRDLIGKPMAEALPELQGQGFEDVLTRVLETGEPYVGTGVPAQLRVKPESPPEQRYVDFVYAALRESDGTRSGVVRSDTTSHREFSRSRHSRRSARAREQCWTMRRSGLPLRKLRLAGCCSAIVVGGDIPASTLRVTERRKLPRVERMERRRHPTGTSRLSPR